VTYTSTTPTQLKPQTTTKAAFINNKVNYLHHHHYLYNAAYTLYTSPFIFRCLYSINKHVYTPPKQARLYIAFIFMIFMSSILEKKWIQNPLN